nr:mulatexin-like [Lolium perenne]
MGLCMSNCISRALISPCHAPNCTEETPPPPTETPPPPVLETPPPPPPPALVTPPALAPVLAPGPAPPVSCNDCRAPLIPACTSNCSAAVSATCLKTCSPQNQTLCDECRTMNSNCTACCDDGTCSCDCKTTGDFDCRGRCYVQYTGCNDCKRSGAMYCMLDCLSPCSAICAKEP